MYFRVKIKKVIRETERAFLIDFDFDEIWIPKSVVNILHSGKTIRLKSWFFKKNWHWLSKLKYVKEFEE